MLDFFADWCGPCRAQGKILRDVAETAAETQTLIVKINVDEHPQLAKEFQVSSLPTLMMLNDGEILRRQTGVTSKNRNRRVEVANDFEAVKKAVLGAIEA